jgi:hypothetical protein
MVWMGTSQGGISASPSCRIPGKNNVHVVEYFVLLSSQFSYKADISIFLLSLGKLMVKRSGCIMEWITFRENRFSKMNGMIL